MKKLKLSIFFVGLMLGLVSLPGFAVELNSGNVTQAPFDCAIDSIGCNLSNLNITGIAENTFVNHDDLIQLNLEDNEISTIVNGTFLGLSMLEELILSENQISSIESGDFMGLGNLEELDLSSNEISSVDKACSANELLACVTADDYDECVAVCSTDQDFLGLSNLELLNLSFNEINHISSGAFLSLINLRNLYLGNNQLDTIFDGSFGAVEGDSDGCTAAELLVCLTADDYDECIAACSENDSFGLANLRYLTLENNYLCMIEENSLDDLVNLVSLSIGENYLERYNLVPSVLSFLDSYDSDWEDDQTLGMCGLSNISDYIDLSLTPENQNAIYGTVVDFDVSVTNNTGIDVYLVQEFPSGVSYSNANITPLNNPALILGIETNPRWLLSAGQTLDLEMDAIVEIMSFGELKVFSNVARLDNYNLVYTSAVAIIDGIADVSVEKTMISNGPQLTGDIVKYNIKVKNIGSRIATGIDVVDVWPSNVLTFSNYFYVDGVMQVPTIYNNISNAYVSSILDIRPGDEINILVEGMYDEILPFGTAVDNEVFVVVGSNQYSTGNDGMILTGFVRGLADLWIDVDLLSSGANWGLPNNEISYEVSYGNTGDEAAGGVLMLWNLSDNFVFQSSSVPLEYSSNGLGTGVMLAGQTGSFVITGYMDSIDPNQYFVGVDVEIHALLGSDMINGIGTRKETNYDNNTGSTQNNVQPSLYIVKELTSVIPQLTGDDLEYTISIVNTGIVTANDLVVVDQRPYDYLSSPVGYDSSGVNGANVVDVNGDSSYIFDPVDGMLPGFNAVYTIVGDYISMLPVGSVIENTLSILSGENFNIINSSAMSYILSVGGLADVYVTVNQISQNPTMIGDSVAYSILYGNSGTAIASGVLLENTLPSIFNFDEASIVPSYELQGLVSWALGSLDIGASGEIILTGVLMPGAQVGDIFVNSAEISTIDLESDYTNNVDTATGEVLAVSDLSMVMYANNLTDPSRNIDTGSNILAISGDVVLLEIMLDNGGNTIETGVLSISNINDFVGYDGLTSWDIVVSPQTNQNISLTGLVGKNFVSFVPTANLNHNGILITDSIIIDEPLSCGDGLITQTEMCDTLGQIGDMLPGQHCEDIAGMCTIVTDGILNIVHMDYVTSLGIGNLSASVLVDYEYTPSDLQCNDLTSDYGVVIVYEDNQGSMEFTCDAVNGVAAEEIRIDCDNGDIGIGVDTNSFVYECNYEYDEDLGEDGNIYNVQCFVNNETNDNCEKSIAVGEGFYGVCGDGRLDDGERCDLGGNYNDEKDIDDYLDLDEEYDADEYGNDDYYCKNCRIKKDNTPGFVYQTPPCLMVNTTISIMKDELMPFWWRLWERDNMKFRDHYDCDDIDDDETRTIIDKDSMKCSFEIYNGNSYPQEDNDMIGELENVDCFEKDDGIIFNYFGYTYNVDFDNVAGRMVKDVSSLIDENIEEYGEYKLVLKNIEYEYCNPETKEWDDGRLYEGICEVNFALTTPYIMQISTLGIDPTASSAVDFLKDFYDMGGDNLIKSTDINETMEVDDADYELDSSVVSEMQGFADKYRLLSIIINDNFELGNNKTIGSLFNGAEVRKVPNKLIFFVNGNGTLTLKQLTEYFPGTPFTIYVEGMDVEVEGDVMTNGMIITDQQIFFEDEIDDDGYCDEGGQTVQGIFVAQGGFDSSVTLRNKNEDSMRCQWGNLQVKGVLIGGGLDTLMERKRSHLNDWFQVDSNSSSAIKRERKNEIFEGASVLIEYSPDLWSHLPPGAELFTESLDVYKK